MSDDRDLRRATDEFLLQLLANGRKLSSVSSYARELDLLRRYPAGRRVRGITTSDVSRFLASPPVRARRDGREKAVATLNRTKAVIRTFFAWCESTKRADGNPAFLVKASPCTPRIRYRTRLEIRRFINEMRRSTHKLARRDYALFSTIVYTGLRFSEATRALWGDADLRRCQLLVRLAKGGRQEIRHIPGRLLHTLIALRRDVEDVIDLDKWLAFSIQRARRVVFPGGAVSLRLLARALGHPAADAGPLTASRSQRCFTARPAIFSWSTAPSDIATSGALNATRSSKTVGSSKR